MSDLVEHGDPHFLDHLLLALRPVEERATEDRDRIGQEDVAEPAIETRTIAEALGETLDLPVRSIDPADADEHFGVVGSFFGRSLTGTSEHTQRLLSWTPTGPTLIDDIHAGAYA